MTPAELKRELTLWHRTGEQDAGNVMDTSELRDLFGPLPTVTEIKGYLLENYDENAAEFPEHVTADQRRQLVDAWVRGWAGFASRAMRDLHERGRR